MRDHERDYRSLLLGERQELRRKLAADITIERNPELATHKPCRTENRSSGSSGGSPSASARSINQTRPFGTRLGFRRCISFDVHKWRYERDLKLDLLATQRGSGGQRCDLGKRTRELRHSLN